MCIAKYSQLNPETLLSFGGTATISPELAKAIKYQRRCTLDTEQQIFREGDGFEYKVDMTKNLVTLLKGTICTADNTGFVNIKSAPMKGYSVVRAGAYFVCFSSIRRTTLKISEKNDFFC